MKYLFLFFLLLLNGILAMFELAVISSRKTHLEEKAANGSKGAVFVLDLQNDPAKFLSTTQIGITIIGILTGAVSGLTVGTDLVPLFQLMGFTPHLANAVSIVL